MQITRAYANAVDLAHQSATYFRRRDYPFLAIEVQEYGDFPYLSLWHDEAETVWIIVYFDDPALEAAAVAYANELASREEYGALGWAASSYCVICAEDLEARRW